MPFRQDSSNADKLKKSAEDKTGNAMKLLNEKHEFCTLKLAELERQADLRTNEIKACLAKGQKDKAKIILKRKKIIEKQMEAVRNVRSHHAQTTSLGQPSIDRSVCSRRALTLRCMVLSICARVCSCDACTPDLHALHAICVYSSAI